MTTKESITWFKTTFSAKLQSSVKNTPHCADLLAAIFL